jgi:broad specificity phosphatase PhoE
MEARGNIRRKIRFVRHANRMDLVRPEWLVDSLRPYDTPLSEDGHEQARHLAAFFARDGWRPAHIFSSPFCRAVQTAGPSARMLGMKIKIEPGLGENYYETYFPVPPTFEPTHLNAADLHDEGLIDTSYRPIVFPDHPESHESSAERARRTIKAILEQHAGDILCFTHGGIVHGLGKALVRNAVLLPHLASLMEFTQYHDGSWSVTRDGADMSHLPQDMVVYQ